MKKYLSVNNRFYILIIILFVFGIFIKNLAFWSDSQTFIFGDSAIYSLYLSALKENLGSILTFKDNILFWNPSYLSVGLPTLSSINMGILYPPNIILVFISSIIDNTSTIFSLHTISIFIHLIFGSVFVYLLLQKFWKLNRFSALVGGLLWIFMGFNLEFIPAASVLMASSYLPACLYTILLWIDSGRKYTKHFFLFFILLSLSFLRGYPMASLLVYVTSLPFIFFYKNEMNFTYFIYTLQTQVIGIFLITLPIISPLYFTSFMYLNSSTRNALTLAGFLQNPAYFSNIIDSILPINTPFNSTSVTNIVLSNFSLVGILLLLQVKKLRHYFINRKNQIILLLGIGGLIFSLGSVTPLPGLIYFTIPFIGLFRRLSVFSLVSGFAFCILVGQVTKSSISNSVISKPIKYILVLLLFLAVLSSVLRMLFINDNMNIEITSLVNSLSLASVIVFVFLIALLIYKTNEKIARILIILVLFIEAGTIVSSKVFLNSPVNPADVFAPNGLTRAVQGITRQGERVDMAVTQNNYSTEYFNIEQTAGYLALPSRFGVEIGSVLSKNEYNPQNLRDILGIKYIVKEDKLRVDGLKRIREVTQNKIFPQFYKFDYNSSLWKLEPQDTTYYIYSNPTAKSRLYLATEVHVSEQSKEVIERIKKLNDSSVVFVKGDSLNEVDKKVSQGNVKVLEYKRNYIKASVKVDNRGFLANSTGYYPGWWVRVDGKWSRPVQTNWFMMGTYVPAGDSIVEFIYLPYGVIFGGIYIMGAALFWRFSELKFR